MRAHDFRRNVGRLLLCVLLGLAGGCGKTATEPPPPDDAPGALPFPDEPDQVAANLLAAYEGRRLDHVSHLLTADYVMPLQAQAANQYPDLGGAIERPEALRIHERLFAGRDVSDPNDALVPAVTAIDFQTFERAGAWLPAVSGDPYPGAEAAFYDVVMLLDRGAGRSLLKVQGTLRLHVVERDSVVAGVTRPYFALRAITDLTIDNKAAESINLCRLLGLWR